jgi:hypothetical protein
MAGQQKTGCLINEAFQVIQEYLAGQAAERMEHVSDEQYRAGFSAE